MEKDWNVKWSLGKEWVVKIGEQVLVLPEHMEKEATLIGAAPQMLELLQAILNAADCLTKRGGEFSDWIDEQYMPFAAAKDFLAFENLADETEEFLKAMHHAN